MNMATLQLYKNKYRYPHYSESITAYGSPMQCTPVGVNLKTGTLRVKGDMTDFMSCNYLSLKRDGQTIYAWIDNVQFLNEGAFTVSYSVDAWRTFKSKIELGTQFVARQPELTTKRDNLLGSITDYPHITSILQGWDKGSRTTRILVVQVNGSDGEIFSNTPVNPTPYQFFMKEFDINNWVSDTTINRLMTVIQGGAETKNIVTMYSIPYMDLTGLTPMPLPVMIGSSTELIDGFKMLRNINDPTQILTNYATIDLTGIEDMAAFLRVPHSVQIVIPEAGILNIPDEILVKGNLQLRQDVDLFSGACNYMLQTGANTYYGQSVRGSSISSIPVVSDPLDTYLSQNQNALATSLIGDVASIVGGGVSAVATGGIGAAMGGSMAASGVNNIINRVTGQMDMANQRPSNPPAFLGTALASNFNQCFWVITSKGGSSNADLVHANYGYPINLIQPLIFPTNGFIQTEGCNVYSKDGSVPAWAIEEINNNFNRGILVH